MKKEKPNSGRSKNQSLINGERRIVYGKRLAPRSARKKGRIFLSDCKKKDYKIAQIIKEEEWALVCKLNQLI